MKDYELWWEVLREYLHKERRKTLKNVVLNRGTGLNDIDTLMTILSNAEYQQHQNRKQLSRKRERNRGSMYGGSDGK